MAVQAAKIILGIDVSKNTLDICEWGSGQRWQLDNDPGAIAKWLKSLPGPAQMALEPTSSYHLEVIEQATKQGHEVYLVNPRQLAHYRRAVGVRNKTDMGDAWLLARYLSRERSELRVFQPHSRQAQRVWCLVKRRALLVATQQQLRQSLSQVKLSAEAVYRELSRLIQRIDRLLLKLIQQLGWSAAYRCCLSIPGIGPLNAAALTVAYHRGAFSSSDAFIAYLGLDVRIRESGQYVGKRKLTKHGEPELRRLLYCAARPSRCYAPFDLYYHRQLDKGLSKTASNVILARKLARIAFALLRNQQTFTKHPQEACLAP